MSSARYISGSAKTPQQTARRSKSAYGPRGVRQNWLGSSPGKGSTRCVAERACRRAAADGAGAVAGDVVVAEAGAFVAVVDGRIGVAEGLGVDFISVEGDMTVVAGWRVNPLA